VHYMSVYVYTACLCMCTLHVCVCVHYMYGYVYTTCMCMCTLHVCVCVHYMYGYVYTTCMCALHICVLHVCVLHVCVCAFIERTTAINGVEQITIIRTNYYSCRLLLIEWTTIIYRQTLWVCFKTRQFDFISLTTVSRSLLDW